MVVLGCRAVETETIRVAVNGVERDVPRGTTVAELCRILGVERGRVAVERNEDVVPRKTYDEVTLSAGDRLEVVSFVGGG
jgi:sulfur carrier protein